jgi:hypothetical protein
MTSRKDSMFDAEYAAENAKWERGTDRVVDRTADRISRALDAMVRDLPEHPLGPPSPQLAIELVIAQLAVTQPYLMRLIFEDPYIREAYYAATAESPATAK